MLPANGWHGRCYFSLRVRRPTTGEATRACGRRPEETVMRSRVLAAIGMAGALVVPAQVQAETLIGGNIGYFALKGEDSRASRDVLWENLDFLTFDLHDFNTATFGGDVFFGLNDFIEAGVGVGYYERSVPSIYTRFEDPDGTEVDQDLSLRIAPVTFGVRFFPAGRHGAVQPYVGGGVAVLAWKYRESGEFINFDAGNRIFEGTYEDRGNAAAPVAFGGVRFPVGDSFLIGGEFRWHGGKADLDPNQGFAGDRIDLGAYTTQAVFQIRF